MLISSKKKANVEKKNQHPQEPKEKNYITTQQTPNTIEKIIFYTPFENMESLTYVVSWKKKVLIN